ncbi:MAG TPA: DUF2231 domain-containing protein [Pirellulales bacterium]|nr:DUF2231 domain-containing protein [Pirellulales bacterium]
MSTKIFGHYIHPILIVFPLGLLTTSFIFDLIHLASGNPEFARVAYWMIVSGIIGGLAAAPFGTVDWVGIPSGTRAKRIGVRHAFANVVMLALFIASWLLRSGAPGQPGALPIVLSLIGVGCGAVGGWLGGELVERLGIGVHPDAHMDAPSSLGPRDARESVRSDRPHETFLGGPKGAH